MKKKKIIAVALLGASLLTGCAQSKIASQNISTSADNFEVNRRVTFINGITGDTTFVVEGFCSITKDNEDAQLEVTCKDANGGYTKDYFGLSNNSYYLLEQLDSKNVSVYHRRVIMNPEAVIPNIEVQTSGN